MTRNEHNNRYAAKHGHKKPDDIVQCNMFGGGGATSQYDTNCSKCWLGFTHTWEQHDESLRVYYAMVG